MSDQAGRAPSPGSMRPTPPADVLSKLKERKLAEMEAANSLRDVSASSPAPTTVGNHAAVDEEAFAKLGNKVRRRGQAAEGSRFAYSDSSGGTLKIYFPMWTGQYYPHKKTGKPIADIVLLAVWAGSQNGDAVRHAMRKGFRHLEDVSPECENYPVVRKHMLARNRLMEMELSRLDRQRELVLLGIAKKRTLERPEGQIRLFEWYREMQKKVAADAETA